MSTAMKNSVEERLKEVIDEYLAKGPGCAQEGVVLREAQERLGLRTLEEEQELLTIWHNLFLTGQLSWGYNVDNPGPPFFHRPSTSRA